MIKNFLDSLLSFAYPENCVHCGNSCERGRKLLCSSCFEKLELLNCLHRCPLCFAESENYESNKPCDGCLHKERYCDYKASCFEYLGPQRSIIKEFKYFDRPYLSKALAPFLFLQFSKLKWPLPDIITSVPSAFLRRLFRGYNQSELLAQELSKYLTIPYRSLLKKTESSISQTKLSYEERKKIPASLFQVRKKEVLENKILLLVDDVYTTGTTLEACARALRQGYPKQIYALSVCV